MNIYPFEIGSYIFYANVFLLKIYKIAIIHRTMLYYYKRYTCGEVNDIVVYITVLYSLYISISIGISKCAHNECRYVFVLGNSAGSNNEDI